MGELRLMLLGRPQVVCDDTPLTGWALRKSLALLAYLAVTGRPHSRGTLAGLLWRDRTEANARSDLRKVLAELRRRVPSYLAITRTEVAFDRATAYWLDVEAFERGIGQAPALRESPVTPAAAAALVAAMELYRGDFLAGLDLHMAPAFEEWVLLEREHLHNLALRALHALVDHHAARRSPSGPWPLSTACWRWNRPTRRRTATRCCCWPAAASGRPRCASTRPAAGLCKRWTPSRTGRPRPCTSASAPELSHACPAR